MWHDSRRSWAACVLLCGNGRQKRGDPSSLLAHALLSIMDASTLYTPTESPSGSSHLILARQPDTCSIGRLNPDVLYDIFRVVFYAASCRFAVLFQLMRVCRRWRHIVGIEKRLWNTFAPFSDAMVPGTQSVFQQLEPAQTINIFVDHQRYSAPISDEHNVLGLLTENLERVACIRFCTTTISVAFAFRHIFEPLKTFSALRFINIKGPRAVSLHGCTLVAPVLLKAHFGHLDSVPSMVGCEQITGLVIEGVHVLPQDCLVRLDGLKIRVLELGVEDMERSLQAVEQSRKTLTLSNLTSLTLGTEWDHLFRFFAAVGGLRSLTHLCLKAFSPSPSEVVSNTKDAGMQAIINAIQSVFTIGDILEPDELLIASASCTVSGTLSKAAKPHLLERHVSLSYLEDNSSAKALVSAFVAQMAAMEVPKTVQLRLSGAPFSCEVDPFMMLNALAPVKELQLSGSERRVQEVLEAMLETEEEPVPVPACIVLPTFNVNREVVQLLGEMAPPEGHRLAIVIIGKVSASVRGLLDKERRLRVQYLAGR